MFFILTMKFFFLFFPIGSLQCTYLQLELLQLISIYIISSHGELSVGTKVFATLESDTHGFFYINLILFCILPLDGINVEISGGMLYLFEVLGFFFFLEWENFLCCTY